MGCLCVRLLQGSVPGRVLVVVRRDGRRAILKIEGETDEPRANEADQPAGSGVGAPVAFVLMAGGFSPPPLSVAAGCSLLDLRLTADSTVVDRWLWAVSTLERAGLTGDRLCLCGGSAVLPETTLGGFKTVLDRSDYRGPAGALRDACESISSETTIIAAEAARCCTIDLSRMLSTHRLSGADVTVGRNADQSPAGIYMISQALLATVPHAGFMDLKEQWLAQLISKGRHVQVHELREEGAIPLRTRAEFLRAVRVCNGWSEAERGGGLEPRIVRGTRRVGSVVCDGATVAADAVLVDSLVMPGARVGAGSLVARCVVGPRGVVGAGEELLDAVVGPGGVVRDGASLSISATDRFGRGRP